MNTINARPVLVNSNKKIELGSLFEYVIKTPFHDDEIDGEIGSLVININPLCSPSIYYKHKELVLIDLDNKNIVEGDKVILYNNLNIFTVKSIKDGRVIVDEYPNLTINLNIVRKIIATQEQLSPEYINTFVDEYNTSKIKDIKIKVKEDKFWDNIQSVIDNPNREPDAILITPLLTNGYITIVKSDVETIQDVIDKHTDKLNILKDNRAKWEEDNWSDEELEQSDNMIKLLASVLIDLTKIKKNV